MESAKNQQVHVRSPLESELYVGDSGRKKQSLLTHTAARTI
jgi:hypothetical protein